PSVQGTLTIDGRSGVWRGSIGGFDVPVRRSGDTVAFVLSGGYGEFRARIASNQAFIRGHWIQPASVNPYNQRYASPVELVNSGQNVWEGTVAPLPYRISFFISIQPRTGDTLSASIRNPEANYFAGRRYRVELRGNTVKFIHPSIPEEG